MGVGDVGGVMDSYPAQIKCLSLVSNIDEFGLLQLQCTHVSGSDT